MSWLFENPWPVIWLAVLAQAVLAAVLFNTGRGAVLYLMGAVLAVALAVVAVEWLVVTEVEEVENTLDGVAGALERNDLPAVLSYLAPEAGAMRNEAEAWLPRVEITEARITGNLRIQVRGKGNAALADARFVGRISARGRGSTEGFPYDSFVRPFHVKLRKQGDRWLLSEYSTVLTPTDAAP